MESSATASETQLPYAKSIFKRLEPTKTRVMEENTLDVPELLAYKFEYRFGTVSNHLVATRTAAKRLPLSKIVQVFIRGETTFSLLPVSMSFVSIVQRHSMTITIWATDNLMNFLRQIIDEFFADHCTTLAAALAYYTAFALPPLLYLLVTILTYSLSVAYDTEKAQKQAEQVIEGYATQMLGNQSASDEISQILENNRKSSGKWWKMLLSFVGILVGATGVMGALQNALNQVWDITPDMERRGVRNLIGKRLLSLGMILGLGFVLLVSLIVSSLLSGAGERIGEVIGIKGVIAFLVNYSVQALAIYIFFCAIFKFMPDIHVYWRDVFVGAGMTTGLFLLGQFGMQLYFHFSDPAAQLGSAAASFAVILLWVYYSAIILLIGAEATQVYSARHEGKKIEDVKSSLRL